MVYTIVFEVKSAGAFDLQKVRFDDFAEGFIKRPHRALNMACLLIATEN
ncbi:hypothetical protein J2X76_003281 [Neorhizobium sp. 2083]|nr:hypothetical protein [Neorhizobium sp. 2083]MDR6818104.1 hypothetical protein [Neorhizobium sp. 2083]